MEAIIFDMDGTLVDSMPYHTKSWHLFFESKQIKVTSEALKEKGHGTVFDIMPRFFGTHISDEESYRLGMEKEVLFRELYRPHMVPITGLKDWLNCLKENKMKIGLGTAADFSNTDFTLDTLQIRNYFDAIITSDLVKEGKPSPAVYLYTAEKLGVDPANCLVFEDTFVGVAAGKAAGMKVAAITTTHTAEELIEKGVDVVLSNYHEASLDKLKNLFV